MKLNHKRMLQVIGSLVISGFLLAACTKEQKAELKVRKEIDETTTAVQKDIKATIKDLKAQVDAAAVEAGNLPSQRFKADMAKADLDEIGRRLVLAAELEGLEAKRELQNSADGYNALIEAVNKAAKEAEGDEAAQLTEFATLLEARKQEVIEAINSMP